MIIITHSDADGIISAHLIQKIAGPGRIVFASPNSLSKVLNYLSRRKKEKLIILDIAPVRETMSRASQFQEVLWIDHHESSILNTPSSGKISLIHSKMPSTAAVIAQKFNLGEKLVGIANEIDTNNVKSEDAKRLRDYISYIKDTARGIVFQPMAKELIKRLDNLSFLSFPEIALKVMAHKVREKQKIENTPVSTIDIRNNKVIFVENKANIANYEIMKNAKGDYIIILNSRHNGTKLDFRTNSNRNVLQLAKLFNGSGHLHAAGAITTNRNLSNIKKKIVNFIKKKT